MAGTATARGAAKPKPAPKPRSTTRKPVTPQEYAAAEGRTTPVSGTVSAVPDAPDVPGGAVTLGASVPAIERETLFYVDGVGYTIPKQFPPNAALGYAHVARTQGVTAAVDWALEQALGTVGYAVLRDQRDLEQQTLDNMVALIIARIEGLPDPKPKRS